jgi:tRNA threonylcarbamoyladenosine biosynthesis protein TsaE
MQHHAHRLDEPAVAALAAALGARARPGAFVALIGDLGAGKTVFSRAFARGLGVTDRVTSPTFVVAQVYESAPVPFVHADLYRVGAADEIDALGLDVWLPVGVAVVEWADRFPEILPPERLEVRITGEGEVRDVVFEAYGAGHATWLRESLGA